MRIHLYFILSLISVLLSGQTIYVSPKGNDKWNGSESRPVADILRVMEVARSFSKDDSVDVILEDGTYYLPSTIKFTSDDSKEYPAKVIYKARNFRKAVVSGGIQMELKWVNGKDNVYAAKVLGDDDIDQLYLIRHKCQMARFPNSVDEKNRNVYDTCALRH